MWLLCFMSSILPFYAEENCVTWKPVDVGLLYKSCGHYNYNFRWFSVIIIFFFLLRNIQVFLFNHVCTCESEQEFVQVSAEGRRGPHRRWRWSSMCACAAWLPVLVSCLVWRLGAELRSSIGVVCAESPFQLLLFLPNTKKCCAWTMPKLGEV